MGTNHPVSLIDQTLDSLALAAERLRLARIRGWQTTESTDTLQLAAEKVERFRLSLMRLQRETG